MTRRQDSLSHSLDTLPPPHDTDPSNLAPDSTPEGFDAFGRLVRDTMRHELQTQLEPLRTELRIESDRSRDRDRILTDAVNLHRATHRRDVRDLKIAIGVRLFAPFVAIGIASAALYMAFSAAPAQADWTVCTPAPADAGGP